MTKDTDVFHQKEQIIPRRETDAETPEQTQMRETQPKAQNKMRI